MNEQAGLKVLDDAIQSAWDFSFSKLYHRKTNMFCDFLTADSVEEMMEHFPTPEEIENSSPNPCGWGTGMEDSTLSLCTMLEAILARYQVTRDLQMKKYADMMYEGLRKNGTASEEPGFIARCVCPRDGKSVYMDSSRDQYTHWVFGAYLLLNSELADDEQKAVLRDILVNVARKTERDVKPENGGYLLRLDGKPGTVSCMDSDELGAHEFLRLPMIYMAAYEASNDIHWLEKYHECRERTLKATEEGYTQEWVESIAYDFGYIYGIYQAQYSYRLLYDCEKDPSYKERYNRLLTISAKSSGVFLKDAYSRIDEICVSEPRCKHWREVPADGYFFFHGYSYYIPSVCSGYVDRYLRNVSEAIIIQTLCPEYAIEEEQKNIFCEFVEKAKFAEASNYWPLIFCDAWWKLKQTGQLAAEIKPSA